MSCFFDYQLHQSSWYMYKWTFTLPALVTLEHIFSTVATHSWVSWHWGTTAGALQCLSRGLEIIIEVSILYHQVTGNNRDRELNLHICLSSGQGHLSGLVPKSRSTTLLECLQTSSEHVIIINFKYTDTRFISFNETCKLILADPKSLLVLQLHHGLHCSVVVVDVEDTHHLGPLEVTDPEGDLGDGVATHQLHYLSGGGELGVHFDRGQLQVLYRRKHMKSCTNSATIYMYIW